MNEAVNRRYLWLVALMALVGLVADQASKYVVFAQLYPGDRAYQVVEGNFELRAGYIYDKGVMKEDPGDQLSFLRTISAKHLPHVNRGALFGIGKGDGESGGWNSFFACVSVAAAIFIVFWVRRPSVAQDRFLCLALGLILAGTLGNLYDRIVFEGVRDFLHFYYIREDNTINSWPDFNVADCCLVCGAVILLVHSFLVKEKAAEPAKAEATPAPLQTPTPAAGA